MKSLLGMCLMIACAVAAAQNAPAKPPCSAPENRQFDFWAGEWNVTNPAGQQAGRSSVVPILGGCVLHEHWYGAKGANGESFNIWDARRQLWHQTWVDGSGNTLMLEGRFADGAMTLSDRGMPGKGESKMVNEIIWTALPDGAVRQHWRVSQDGGATWTTSFDGKYVRKN